MIAGAQAIFVEIIGPKLMRSPEISALPAILLQPPLPVIFPSAAMSISVCRGGDDAMAVDRFGEPLAARIRCRGLFRCDPFDPYICFIRLAGEGGMACRANEP